MSGAVPPSAWTSRPAGGLLGGALMVYGFDVAPEHEAEVDAWYAHEHLPERVGTPGFLRGRRYRRAAGSPGAQHLTVYETSGTDVFTSPEYLRRLESPTPATREQVARFVEPSRSVLDVLASHGATAGRALAVVELDGPSDALLGWWAEAVPSLLADPLLLGAHLAAVDVTATGAKAATAEGRGSTEGAARAVHLLLVDGVAAPGAAAARAVAGAPATTGPVATYDLVAVLDAAALRPHDDPGAPAAHPHEE